MHFPIAFAFMESNSPKTIHQKQLIERKIYRTGSLSIGKFIERKIYRTESLSNEKSIEGKNNRTEN